MLLLLVPRAFTQEDSREAELAEIREQIQDLEDAGSPACAGARRRSKTNSNACEMELELQEIQLTEATGGLRAGGGALRRHRGGDRAPRDCLGRDSSRPEAAPGRPLSPGPPGLSTALPIARPPTSICCRPFVNCASWYAGIKPPSPTTRKPAMPWPIGGSAWRRSARRWPCGRSASRSVATTCGPRAGATSDCWHGSPLSASAWPRRPGRYRRRSAASRG